MFCLSGIGKTVGFLGCGKIGRAMVRPLLSQAEHKIAFIQHPNFVTALELTCPIVDEFDEAKCQADLVVECATADVLKNNYANFLCQSNLMTFSISALSDPQFLESAVDICRSSGTQIYLPHGAILGLDGIFDARELISNVRIETIKSPATLGRSDEQRTVVYEGDARGAVRMFPRNANVHAAIALAGIGLDKTSSRIVADPDVSTNTHKILVSGEGIEFKLDITTQATGGVTGKYTPISACGSLDRVLGTGTDWIFV